MVEKEAMRESNGSVTFISFCFLLFSSPLSLPFLSLLPSQLANQTLAVKESVSKIIRYYYPQTVSTKEGRSY